MSNYFIPAEACPNSKDLLLHSTIVTVRCGPCGLLNPSYLEPSLELPRRAKSRSSSARDPIEISEDSPTPPSKTVANIVPPAKRRGGIQIPTIPNFKIGYAEKERQSTNERIIARKPKSGFDTSEGLIVHFNVGIAHFTFDDSHEDGGYWTALKSSFTIDEINRDR